MNINVHVKDRVYEIICGKGSQRIRWLGDVSLLRHSNFSDDLQETVKGVRLENGTELNLDAPINKILEADTHVWILLKGELKDSEMEEKPEKVKPKPIRIRPSTANVFRK